MLPSKIEPSSEYPADLRVVQRQPQRRVRTGVCGRSPTCAQPWQAPEKCAEPTTCGDCGASPNSVCGHVCEAAREGSQAL